MEHYVGLDVSMKLTAICIIDRTGKIEREGVVASDPEAIATFIKLHASYVVRIGLETGATSTWLWTELNKMGLPVICIDARHAKAALKMQINKSDRNDAVGIARIMQCGWYRRIYELTPSLVVDHFDHSGAGARSGAGPPRWVALLTRTPETNLLILQEPL